MPELWTYVGWMLAAVAGVILRRWQDRRHYGRHHR